ncbi:MAG: hypothetical protein F4229_17545 [Gammaproteobacteria bacterium]|nr:hypothetical protein [Gammaproteobacteria bacterium]
MHNTQTNIPARRRRGSTTAAGALVGGMLVLGIATTGHAADFVAFESGPVRPMALSADGRMLYVVNPPENCRVPGGLDCQGDAMEATEVETTREWLRQKALAERAAIVASIEFQPGETPR